MQLAGNQFIVTDLIRFIIEEAERMIYFNTLISKNLTQYCYSQSIKYTQATYNEMYRNPQQNQNQIIQKQPQALIQDNFFPTAAAIDQQTKQVQRNKKSEQKKQVKILRNKTQVSQSQPKKLQKQQQNNPFEQLKLSFGEEQQAILKELRKQVIDQEIKENEKNKKNDQKPKKQQGKQKKQEKLGFDYNGQIIKVKFESKNKLISGGLNGQTLKTAEKTKQVKMNSNYTTIQYERKDKKFFKLGKNNQIQFTDIRTLLSQAKASKGTKFIQDGRIIEEKHKQMPVKQLMKSLSGRKLTKQQYRKIKEVTGNLAQFDDLNANKNQSEIKNQMQQNLSQLRSGSQSKLSNSILTRRKSTITVSDPQLLQNLITGIQNQGSFKITNPNIKNQQEKEEKNKFDSNDYYNLQYIKKGGSIQTIKKSKSISDLSDTKLPRIQPNKLQMPRVRQRIKGKEQIVRIIRKKFQQKLRT